MYSLTQEEGLSPYVVSSLEGRATGRPFPARTIEQRLDAQLGLAPELCSPHKLRHTHATALLDAGHWIEEVRELLGHASIATTQVYVHVNAARLDHAAASLPDVLDLAP